MLGAFPKEFGKISFLFTKGPCRQSEVLRYSLLEPTE